MYAFLEFTPIAIEQPGAFNLNFTTLNLPPSSSVTQSGQQGQFTLYNYPSYNGPTPNGLYDQSGTKIIPFPMTENTPSASILNNQTILDDEYDLIKIGDNTNFRLFHPFFFLSKMQQGSITLNIKPLYDFQIKSTINQGYQIFSNITYNQWKSCQGFTAPGGNPSESVTQVFNIDSSLSQNYQNEFHEIIATLNTIIPLYQTNFTTATYYAWQGEENLNTDDPFNGINGGAYVSIQGNNAISVTEISSSSLLIYHKYSVIAHEYFHLYQHTLTTNFPSANWLIEGSAATFESLYIQQFYNSNYFIEGQSGVDDRLINSPEEFESSSSIDTNYSNSVFITLSLVKELMDRGHSEAVAFRMILKDFMCNHQSNQSWESTFEQLFGMSVSTFYSAVQTRAQSNLTINSVLPSSSLKLETIFTNNGVCN